MLTSSNQYLRPEYLTPLPTTLDAKKSPLALLAQTCSQIGADSSNSKLLQSSDKSSKSSKSDSSSKDKGSPNSCDGGGGHPKTGFKSYEASLPREKSRTPEERSGSASTGGGRVRTPLKGGSNGRCSSSQSSASPRTSPSASDRKTPSVAAVDVNGSNDRTSPEKPSERTSPSVPATSCSSSSKTAFTPNILTSSSDPAIKDLPLGTFKPGVPQAAPFLGYTSAGFPLPMDLMTSSLMSQHHALKASSLSPYLTYGRMKSPDSLPPVCRDPYCTGCGVSSHLLSASAAAAAAAAVKTPTSCPAGCSQCDHAKPVTSTAAYLGHGPAAAAYAHAQLAALAAASHLPYVCNWIAGDAAYCGKRFSSSEELLAHLRTHTGAAPAAADAGSLSMHPLLHRTYPTPPLSPLATARYHPYSKPSLLPPSLAASALSGFPLSHPGLSPYLTPYSLYGPRLGAAPGMHP